jgi:hypothetical protein
MQSVGSLILCIAMVRVPGYNSRCPRFDFQRYHFISVVVSLELGPPSLVRLNKEILGR